MLAYEVFSVSFVAVRESKVSGGEDHKPEIINIALLRLRRPRKPKMMRKMDRSTTRRMMLPGIVMITEEKGRGSFAISSLLRLLMRTVCVMLIYLMVLDIYLHIKIVKCNFI